MDAVVVLKGILNGFFYKGRPTVVFLGGEWTYFFSRGRLDEIFFGRREGRHNMF